MKKILSFLLAFSFCMGLTACGNTAAAPGAGTGAPKTSEPALGTETPTETENPGENADPQPEESADEAGSSILVAYFSRTGENYGVGTIEKGNTHIIADMIVEQTGADIFEISTVTPYPDDYDECTDVAKQEQDENARPELTALVENFEDYDVIFLGYPIWWGDMPMAVYTFLESYDWNGKTIIPFSTHAGSGLAGTENDIASACPGAEMLDGLAVSGSVAQNSQDEAKDAVVNWLRETGFAE